MNASALKPTLQVEAYNLREFIDVLEANDILNNDTYNYISRRLQRISNLIDSLEITEEK